MLLGLVLQSTTELARALGAPDAVPASGAQPGEAQRAFPRVSVGGGRQLEYVGAFSADGKFKSLTRFGMFVDSMVNASLASQPPGQPAPKPEEQLKQEDAIMKQVPPSIALHQNERTVEDFLPPEHAVEAAKGHSVMGELCDSLVSLAYGGKRVLVLPQSVTTDSQNRVIVTDVGAHGLHVLSVNAKDSFQIVGGAGRRLQSPSGVAVDGEDNIYASDSERGVVLVYDSSGRFLRSLGGSGEEGLFEHPSGIAIDGKGGRLYVTDPPRHTLFILDLKGNVLARVGTQTKTGTGFSSRTGSTEPGGFLYPQSVLVHNNELIVVDATRVHILNLQGEFLKEFAIQNSADFLKGQVRGLFADADNHIYVSDPASGMIREYSHDGTLLCAFGRPGLRMGEFSALWADNTGRVYIVDARRVQIFRLTSR
jgi:DNA-binding beta-propeller fold protein YncE